MKDSTTNKVIGCVVIGVPILLLMLWSYLMITNWSSDITDSPYDAAQVRNIKVNESRVTY